MGLWLNLHLLFLLRVHFLPCGHQLSLMLRRPVFTYGIWMQVGVGQVNAVQTSGGIANRHDVDDADVS